MTAVTDKSAAQRPCPFTRPSLTTDDFAFQCRRKRAVATKRSEAYSESNITRIRPAGTQLSIGLDFLQARHEIRIYQSRSRSTGALDSEASPCPLLNNPPAACSICAHDRDALCKHKPITPSFCVRRHRSCSIHGVGQTSRILRKPSSETISCVLTVAYWNWPVRALARYLDADHFCCGHSAPSRLVHGISAVLPTTDIQRRCPSATAASLFKSA
jgi:hypothetical protein